MLLFHGRSFHFQTKSELVARKIFVAVFVQNEHVYNAIVLVVVVVVAIIGIIRWARKLGIATDVSKISFHRNSIRIELNFSQLPREQANSSGSL